MGFVIRLDLEQLLMSIAKINLLGLKEPTKFREVWIDLREARQSTMTSGAQNLKCLVKKKRIKPTFNLGLKHQSTKASIHWVFSMTYLQRIQINVLVYLNQEGSQHASMMGSFTQRIQASHRGCMHMMGSFLKKKS